MEEILFCKGGGCTAKLGAGALERVLSKLPKKKDENLLVGFDSHDDAAVYRINDHQAIVSTLDFFPPMIEDPYLFGQIAATNALSDIYAMGGEVLTALNIVCFPETLDMNILGKILQGGNEKVMEAGGVLAGGHSIVDTDIKYGLSVTGMVSPDHIWTNNSPHEDDVLILTKKLGVGIVCTANRIGKADKKTMDEVISSMTTLNRYACDILRKYDVHSCTDVTGFGLLVHLNEMLADRFSASIDHTKIPYFDGCEEYVNEFYLTAAAQKNRNYMADRVMFYHQSFFMEELLYDPQTSGGLLAAVAKEDADKIVREMQEIGLPAQIIGRVEKKGQYQIAVV